MTALLATGHILQPQRFSLAARLRLFVALLLLCFLGLQAIEATHLHQSVALERDCPVCHVAGHQSLDMPPPTLTVLPALLFSLLPYFLSLHHPAPRVAACG